MKILVVEDEPELLGILVESLEKQQYRVEAADNYAQGLEKIISFDYDCILLDVMLPGGSGLNLLRELRAMEKSYRVIIISAKDAIDDKVLGLELGADDYLTKPFHLAELHARVKSVIRRRSEKATTKINMGNLEIDLENRVCKVNNQDLNLNRKEFDILEYLSVNKNRLVQRTALAEHVWGDYMDEADDFEFLYSQVKNLRKKMKEAFCNLEIKAVYGLGYRLEINDEVTGE